MSKTSSEIIIDGIIEEIEKLKRPPIRMSVCADVEDYYAQLGQKVGYNRAIEDVISLLRGRDDSR